MRIYKLSCPRCGWKAPLPVDARVADKFRRMGYCQGCKKVSGVEVPYTIREVIVSYPTPYLPHKD